MYTTDFFLELLLKTVGFHNLAAVFHLNTRYFAEEIKYI
jgi:hypothetical protein